ncbi:hypothetical protein NIIDMKKI_65600 [Mycobacterium kansasii]|uniref:DUF4229 domain-containing protein n=1 Tax=Mycobacterium kansasii TaxID=1768 RepID=A0A1V3WHD0_MYCKA|nr:hypothetical protein BZL30_8773 [Mycobacterium kansasii]BCI91354.1 hypothetical protein NIIDMKKI_65600 [Mycobacterium kansasii]
MSAAPNGNSAEKTAGSRGLVDVALYATARLLLAVVVTGVIYGVARLTGIAEFPVVVAALFGLTIAMPLGMWIFTPLRRQATAALAVAGSAGAPNANGCGPGCEVRIPTIRTPTSVPAKAEILLIRSAP